MKGILKQLGQLILKYRRRLIYGIFALFIGQLCFFGLGGAGIQSEVYAAEGETATQRESFEKIVNEKKNLMDLYRKTAYALLYPIIFLAGKLLDNSFVYGEAFGFDVILWQLWNMVRNFANFGLGFIFLYYILRFLIKNDKNKNRKWLIGRAMIAGIGIQASWFMFAALIDLSTILIYGIGGLPLSILGGGNTQGGDDDQFNPYVLKTVVTVDANDVSNLSVYLTNTPDGKYNGKYIYISECETFSLENDTKGYILAPRMVYYRNGKKGEGATYVSAEPDLCHYFGGVYNFGGTLSVVPWPGSCSDEKTCIDNQSKYDTDKGTILADIKKTGKIPAQVLTIGVTGDNVGLDEDNKNIGPTWGKKLSKLVDDDINSYVGVFSSLYASLLEAGRKIAPLENASAYVQLLCVLISLGHVLAIGIPLLAALLVFIMRIGVLWVAIVISPIIVLMEAFGFWSKMKSKSMEYFQLKNLIGIIFAPAVIAFAVSMSTVLVRLIEKMTFTEIETESIVLGGLVEMNLAGFSVGLGELIVAVMGVAISWFLVWMAIEMSKLGSGGLVSSVKSLATSALGTVPIIPVIGKDENGKLTGSLTSYNAAKTAINNKYNEVKTEFNQGDSRAVEELLNSGQKAKKAEGDRVQYEVQTFVDGLKDAEDIDAKWASFNSFDGSKKKDVIDAINKLDEAKKKQIGEKIGSVKFEVEGKEVEYRFDGKNFTEVTEKN